MIYHQVLKASITWKQCSELPTQLSTGKTTVINGKVYFGGGDTYNNDRDNYIVYCYDPSQDNWTTLSPLPVRWFGLGQVNGKLVAVGGVKGGLYAKEVHTYDERSGKWKQTIPPMPTARWSPGVLSSQSALVVASGFGDSHTAAVEIFKPDTSQWYKTDPLLTSSCDVLLVAVGDTCYALGGYNSGHLNRTLYASVDDLLCNAVPANQINITTSNKSAWKALPDTPTYQPAAAVLAENLFTIGGRETSEGGAFKEDIYMYSPSINSWVYVSDLPGVLSNSAVALLSSTEILVIGGEGDGHRSSIVYKGTLHLKL